MEMPLKKIEARHRWTTQQVFKNSLTDLSEWSENHNKFDYSNNAVITCYRVRCVSLLMGGDFLLFLGFLFRQWRRFAKATRARPLGATPFSIGSSHWLLPLAPPPSRELERAAATAARPFDRRPPSRRHHVLDQHVSVVVVVVRRRDAPRRRPARRRPAVRSVHRFFSFFLRVSKVDC